MSTSVDAPIIGNAGWVTEAALLWRFARPGSLRAGANPAPLELGFSVSATGVLELGDSVTIVADRAIYGIGDAADEEEVEEEDSGAEAESDVEDEVPEAPSDEVAAASLTWHVRLGQMFTHCGAGIVTVGNHERQLVVVLADMTTSCNLSPEGVGMIVVENNLRNNPLFSVTVAFSIVTSKDTMPVVGAEGYTTDPPEVLRWISACVRGLRLNSMKVGLI